MKRSFLPATNRSKQRILILLLAALFLAPCMGYEGTAHAAESPDSEIQILSSDTGLVTLDLVPEEADGFICTGCDDLVRILVNGGEVSHQIQAGGGGEANVTAPFSGLPDGRHKAEAETLGAGGETLATREALFIIDTEPPELDLLEPGTAVIQPTQTAFTVRCRDDGAGISPDPQESSLSVTINGSGVPWQMTEQDGDLILLIAGDVAQWEPDGTVALHVTIQDRAGNPAELSRSFTVETEEDVWDLETIDCVPGDMQTQGLYVLRSIPFPLLTSVHWIRFDAAQRSVTLTLDLSTLGDEPLDPGIYESLEVVSNHPCVQVERIPKSPADSSVEFLVSQVSLPEAGECLGSLTVRYPELVVFDYELSCQGDEPEAAVLGMHTEGALKGYDIPVALHADMSCSDEVEVDDSLLWYRFLLTGPAGLDTALSWFDMEGTRAWLTGAGGGAYEASVPVSEGLHVYTTRLALSLYGWGRVSDGEVSQDGRSLLKTGEVFVTLDPPVIEHFHYDREDECFRAQVSDQGTAPEDLVVELSVSEGTGEQDPGFDPDEGTVLSPYPLPEGIQAALLKVTDLAGQTTTATCRIFGTVTEAYRVEGGQDTSYPATVKEEAVSGARKPSSGSNYHISRQYTGTYKDGKEAVTECLQTRVYGSREPPLTQCLRRAWALYGTTSLTPGTEGSSLKMTGTSSPAPNPELIEAEEACRRKYPPGLRHEWTYETTEECWETWIDTLPPRIRDVAFVPAGRQITALIDDYGMPLSDLNIDYRIEPEPLTRPYYDENRPFSFDTGTGLFLGRTSRRSELEVFKAEIKATDAAGNWSRTWLDVTAPSRPPEVSMDILELGTIFHPMGTCFDASGLDHRKTRAWLDGERVTPIGVRYGTGSSEDRVDFGPVTDEGPHMARLEVTDMAGLSAEASVAFQVELPPEIERFRHLPTSLQNAGGPAFSAVIHDSGGDLDLRGIELAVDGDDVDPSRFYYEPGSGYFAADGPFDFTPGLHQARLTATDAHGHMDEALLEFVPGERIVVSEPEPGDLAIEEVTLWELLDHNGDGRANPGETVRLFVSLTNVGAGPITSLSGRLESEEPDIVVEADQVSYGDVDQGETLTPMHGFDIRIDEAFLDTRPSDPYEARFTLDASAGGGRTWLLDFQLPVYRPTLPFAVAASSPSQGPVATADPADPADPLVADPVISEVTVTLDPLPADTEDPEIEVTGTAVSSASTIEEVTVRVNGTGHVAAFNPGDGTFSVTVPLDIGDNLIEAEAVDRTGAMGTDTGFVHRSEPYVPPEIQIDEPAQGAAFICGNIYLRGGFTAGSSSVASFQASMTGEGETVSLPMGYSSGEGSFWVGAEAAETLTGFFRPDWGNNHVTSITVTVRLTTTDGDTVEDTVTFTYACWS